MWIKIKSFDDAMSAAIEFGYTGDVYMGEEHKFDSIFGIGRNWQGWGAIIEAECFEDEDDGDCYFGADCFVPNYCVERAIDD